MKNTYKTSDLALATYLSSLGFNIVTLDEEFSNNGKIRKIFVFETNGLTKILAAVEKFNTRKAEVEPQHYFDVMKQIKSRIYNN
jgi:hypothetical protein